MTRATWLLRPRAALQVALVSAALCGRAGTSSAASSGLEVPLKHHALWGLLHAAVEVGTPPQKVEVQIDSRSEFLWVASANSSAEKGFHESKSDSLEKPKEEKGNRYAHWANYSDGTSIQGHVVLDTVKLGGKSCERVPLFVGANVNKTARTAVGILGLAAPRGGDGSDSARRRAPSWGFFGHREEAKEEGKVPDSFLQKFWEQHPDLPKALRLELGGEHPRMVIGDTIDEGPPELGGVRFLADTWTRGKSPLWNAPVRAIGFSFGREGGSKSIAWGVDYNQGDYYGAPALLDTGAAAIRVRSITFRNMIDALKNDDCKRDLGGMSCKCEGQEDVEKFPHISISFESADNSRFMGLDRGDDTIVCVPPAAYAAYNPKSGRCEVAIADGGERHVLFGHDSLVLGVPFFRSVTVLLDHERSLIGLGAPLEPILGKRRLSAEGGECPCADPKNWWATGHRLSWRRVVVVLILVSVLATYIFVSHSPSQLATQLRAAAEKALSGISGGHTLGSGGQAGMAQDAGGRPATPDRHFIEMSDARGPE